MKGFILKVEPVHDVRNRMATATACFCSKSERPGQAPVDRRPADTVPTPPAMPKPVAGPTDPTRQR